MYISPSENAGSNANTSPPTGYAFGEFIVDIGASRLLRDGKVIALPSRTFDVLVYLIRHRDRSVRKDEIIAAIWDNVIVTDDSLIHAISVLRRALGDESHQHTYIETIPRRGYRFVGKVESLDTPRDEARPTVPAPAAQPDPVAHAAEVAVATPASVVSGETAAEQRVAGSSLRPGVRTSWLLAGMAVAAAIMAAVALVWRGPTADRPGESNGVQTSVRLSQPSPPGTSIVSGGVLSPDGRYLAFIARDLKTGSAGLWMRALQTTESRLIKGTEDASKPFWSPDSSRIGFFANGKLLTSDMKGEAPTVIAAVNAGAGATWGIDDTIVFADWTTGLFATPASGNSVAAPQQLVKRDARDLAVAWPQFFPDGRRFLYQVTSLDPEREGAYVGDVATLQKVKLLSTSSPVTLAPPRHLLHVQRDMLIAEELDLKRLELTGHAIILARGISEPTLAVENFVSASEGLLAFNQGVKKQNLVWFSREGQKLEALSIPTEMYNPRLSPDGLRVMASSSVTNNPGLWFTSVEREEYTRLETDAIAPVWSPDGKQVAFTSRDGTHMIVRSSNGAGSPVPLMNDEHVKILNDWSSDGKHIVYTRQSPQSGMDLWVIELATGVSRPLIATTHSETQARLSPDGKWIAYTSDESGRLEIYVAGFPGLEHKTRISSNGGGQPQWRSDQKELFYLALDQAIMASAVDGKETPSFATPRALFRTSITGAPGNAREHYAVNAAGTRFLMDANVDAQRSPEISIMVNWASRLRGNEGPNLAQASLPR